MEKENKNSGEKHDECNRAQERHSHAQKEQSTNTEMDLFPHPLQIKGKKEQCKQNFRRKIWWTEQILTQRKYTQRWRRTQI